VLAFCTERSYYSKLTYRLQQRFLYSWWPRESLLIQNHSFTDALRCRKWHGIISDAFNLQLQPFSQSPASAWYCELTKRWNFHPFLHVMRLALTLGNSDDNVDDRTLCRQLAQTSFYAAARRSTGILSPSVKCGLSSLKTIFEKKNNVLQQLISYKKLLTVAEMLCWKLSVVYILIQINKLSLLCHNARQTSISEQKDFLASLC